MDMMLSFASTRSPTWSLNDEDELFRPYSPATTTTTTSDLMDTTVELRPQSAHLQEDQCSSPDSQHSHSSPTEKKKRKPRNKNASQVTLEQLQLHFDKTSVDAAAALSISVSTLKKLCRLYGIVRWPYRKIKSIQRRTDEYQEEYSSIMNAETKKRAVESHEKKQSPKLKPASTTCFAVPQAVPPRPAHNHQDESRPSTQKESKVPITEILPSKQQPAAHQQPDKIHSSAVTTTTATDTPLGLKLDLSATFLNLLDFAFFPFDPIPASVVEEHRLSLLQKSLSGTL